jgi:hypothetical protein
MSIEAIRSAFMTAGNGVLRLTHAGLAYKDSHQVLTFAGSHGRRHAVRSSGRSFTGTRRATLC